MFIDTEPAVVSYVKLFLKILKLYLTFFKYHDKIFSEVKVMLEYLIVKARLDELLREAEAERMLKQAKKQIKIIKGSNVDDQKVNEQAKRSKVHV